jgi:hypothetical protein
MKAPSYNKGKPADLHVTQVDVRGFKAPSDTNKSLLAGYRNKAKNTIRLGIDGIVDILQAYFDVISGIFRIRGLRKHNEMRRYSPDDIIDP